MRPTIIKLRPGSCEHVLDHTLASVSICVLGLHVLSHRQHAFHLTVSHVKGRANRHGKRGGDGFKYNGGEKTESRPTAHDKRNNNEERPTETNQYGVTRSNGFLKQRPVNTNYRPLKAIGKAPLGALQCIGLALFIGQ